MTKTLTPKDKLFDMVLQAAEQIADNLSFVTIKNDMIDQGVSTKMANRVISLTKRYLRDQEFKDIFDYHAQHLTQLRLLYDKLFEAKLYKEAAKVLGQHRESYLYINALMDI